jgi:hypothetical protein
MWAYVENTAHRWRLSTQKLVCSRDTETLDNYRVSMLPMDRMSPGLPANPQTDQPS